MLVAVIIMNILRLTLDPTTVLGTWWMGGRTLLSLVRKGPDCLWFCLGAGNILRPDSTPALGVDATDSVGFSPA